jgi:hypothetical protein
MDRTLKTRCKLCDARGTVKVLGRKTEDGSVQIIDNVKHWPHCPRHKAAGVPKHFQEKKWVKQEKRANALVGARETLMSGAVNEDGDGRILHGWRVESKQTKADKYRLTSAIWEKLCRGALEAGEEPMLHLEIGDLPTRLVLVRSDWTAPHLLEAQGMIETNGKGVTIKPGELLTPMWIEGMKPTPWILTEAEFKRISQQARK